MTNAGAVAVLTAVLASVHTPARVCVYTICLLKQVYVRRLITFLIFVMGRTKDISPTKVAQMVILK